MEIEFRICSVPNARGSAVKLLILGQPPSPEVQQIAWKAQRRLCARYRDLSERGMSSCKIVTAVARELSGFIWAVVEQVRKEQAALT